MYLDFTDGASLPETTIDNVEFDVDGNGNFPIEPVVVHDVEYDIVSITESHSDQCGHTEKDRVGDTGVDMTFNGLLTKRQAEAMKEARRNNDSLYVVTDLHTGSLYIDTFTFTQHSDRNEIEYKDGTDTKKEPVFTFNLELTAEDSDE